MEEKRITEMNGEEFGQLINNFIDRETKDMGELAAPLFYEALESIYAKEETLRTVELEAQVVGKELQLRLPAAIAAGIEVHGNEINVHNLRFVIQLVNGDALSAAN